MTSRQVFPTGFSLIQKAQKYTPLGLRDHVRKDGTQTQLIDWQSQCADCGAEFVCSSPVIVTYLTRRCPDCRKPGVWTVP